MSFKLELSCVNCINFTRKDSTNLVNGMVVGTCDAPIPAIVFEKRCLELKAEHMRIATDCPAYDNFNDY